LSVAVYEKLLSELDEFIRKDDYRFANEPLGEERDSWTRAVAARVSELTLDWGPAFGSSRSLSSYEN
jgi:hypothetical protein